MKKSSNTCDVLYEFVCGNPGLCTYDLSKKLNMSGGRIRHALSRLKQMKLIKFKFEKNNPRIRKLTYPINASKLLPRNLREELKKMI
jgi:predicted transcriptional regulator